MLTGKSESGRIHPVVQGTDKDAFRSSSGLWGKKVFLENFQPWVCHYINSRNTQAEKQTQTKLPSGSSQKQIQNPLVLEEEALVQISQDFFQPFMYLKTLLMFSISLMLSSLNSPYCVSYFLYNFQNNLHPFSSVFSLIYVPFKTCPLLPVQT